MTDDADLSGRPLLDTKPDQKLYVPRIDAQEVVWTGLRRDLNALVVGERGAGKTTFLRHLAYRMREEDIPAVFVEGATTDDADGFLRLVRYRLETAPTGPRERISSEVVTMGRPAGPPLIELVQRLRADLAGNTRTVVLVDEMPDPVTAHTLFGRLRDELWQLPLTWVVAAAETDLSTYLTPPADAFFDVVVQLEPFSRKEQVEFLRKRLGDDVDPLRFLLDPASTGSPRQLLDLARLVAGGARPEEISRARAERERKAAALGRAATMLVAELESLGPLSASDSRLLTRLDWTRERAVQVFRQLEDAGLVTSSEVKDGPGRPRKVYRLKNPGDDS